jgi:hypothetical protein
MQEILYYLGKVEGKEIHRVDGESDITTGLRLRFIYY